MTGKADLTLSAQSGESIQLFSSELSLLLRAHKVDHVVIDNTPQKIAWLNKVITGVKIPIVLKSQSLPADRIENAHAG